MAFWTLSWNPGQKSRNTFFQSAFPADTSSSYSTKTIQVCELLPITLYYRNLISCIKSKNCWKGCEHIVTTSKIVQLVDKKKFQSKRIKWSNTWHPFTDISQDKQHFFKVTSTSRWASWNVKRRHEANLIKANITRLANFHVKYSVPLIDSLLTFKYLEESIYIYILNNKNKIK